MAKRISWGGIRGRGLSLRNDAVLALIALTVATILVILMYFVYERNDVKVYVEKNTEAIERADRISTRTDKVWRSDILSRCADPMSSKLDTADLRQEAAGLAAQVSRDAKAAWASKDDFAAKPSPSKPNKQLFSDITLYLQAVDEYIGDMNEVVEYFNDLTQIEMAMNEAVRAAGYGTGNVSVEAMRQRDAVLEAELAKLKLLTPPDELRNLHDDTVMYLSDFVATEKRLTEAYAQGRGLEVLEAISAESQDTLEAMEDALNLDLDDIRAGTLNDKSHKVKDRRRAVRDEITALKSKYRF